MGKVKYYFDTENLAYRKIKPKKGRNIGYIALFLIASALFGFLSFFIASNSNYFETPKDKIQARQIENMKINYALLNEKIDQLDEVIAAMQERDNNIYKVYFNSAGFEKDEKDSINAKATFKQLLTYDNQEIINFTNKRVDKIAKELAMQSKSLDEILRLAKNKEKFLSSIPAIQPVKNEQLKRMASGYGYRSDPFTKARKMHKGMDFTAPTGTPVFATGDGVVRRADAGASGFGNHIVINHGFGYETVYAHLSRYNCRPGKRVKRGDIIGFVGSTGRSQAPHLHYEVHKNGKVVNPINFYYGDISAVEYTAIAKMATQENQSFD
ncbi:M23 family metallopeptidase [Flavobacterium luminosum]|uniref:M23 family metallopeptidase n=1 Tax=Flavobacterium luminosum TaxID=2949086 RepID=A0ABT0TKR9_9FLAO|nr:M23 family metallopeptidase [Flavobacterium sp. HXWNR70]MCL9807930.1 M23 family metallopeptidase [Flavobacterium sp. HXWNR70]